MEFNFSLQLIPLDFVKHFKGVVPKMALLKDTTGRSWPIKVAEVGNKLFFKSGWRDFVIDHSLEFADFLIFRYNRDSVFLVKIFGKNGCRKEMTCRVNRPLAVVKTEEPADEVNEAEQEKKRPVRACKRKFSDLNINGMENHGTCLLLLLVLVYLGCLLTFACSPFSTVLHGDSHFKTKLEFNGETVSKCSLETYAMPKNPHFISCISKYSLKAMVSLSHKTYLCSIISVILFLVCLHS